ECLGRCHFNSLKYEVTIDKPSIDHLSCFGCGLCMTACSRNAISLVERKSLPALVNAW
ncbi:MAG: 4Fe-4S binding protein, partial [Chloroflexi bacterium]|nr:4Fe-4S binding protein [Chloroflexota bacterium]